MRAFVTLLLICAAATAQTMVTLKGQSYALVDHPRVLLDGPSGSLTTGLTDTMGRKNASNGWYNGLITLSDAYNATTLGGGVWPTNADAWDPSPMIRTYQAAVRWLVDGDATSRLAALWGLNNVDQLWYGNPACPELGNHCGNLSPAAARPNVTDWSRDNLVWAAAAYSIMRGEMTAGERQTFADKLLNDLGDMCSKPVSTTRTGTLSLDRSTGIVTGTGTALTSEVSVGLWIWGFNSQYFIAKVISIADDTHMTVEGYLGSSGTENWGDFSTTPAWSSGDCGFIWMAKHMPFQPFGNSTDYPTVGGDSDYGASNLTMVGLKSNIAAGLALCGDDSRGCDLITEAYDYFYDDSYQHAKQWWTGTNFGGTFYAANRVNECFITVLTMLETSVVSGPNLLGGEYLKRVLSFWPLSQLPYVNGYNLGYMEATVGEQQYGAVTALRYFWYLFPSELETEYSAYYAKTYLNQDASNNANNFFQPQMYIFSDPGQVETDIAAAPTQMLLNTTDQAECSTLFGSACDPEKNINFAISRTGFKDANDSLVFLYGADFQYIDHDLSFGSPGALHIFRNDQLLVGDFGTAGWGSTFQNSSVEIGGNSNVQGPPDTLQTPYQNTEVLRWAGSDPFGDANDRFVYTDFDLTEAFKTGVTRAHRHMVHFKKCLLGGSCPSDIQDYVVLYDDVAASSGTTIKWYMHFAPGSSVNGGTMDFDDSARTATATCGTPTCRLVAHWLTPDGGPAVIARTDNANGTYTGGANRTFRITTCPGSAGTCATNATSGEQLSVFKPSLSESDTMSTALITIDADWTGAEIKDSDPKVAIFHRGGTTGTSVSFTSTFTGHRLALHGSGR